jgi:hypothetical protein
MNELEREEDIQKAAEKLAKDDCNSKTHALSRLANIISYNYLIILFITGLA